MRPCRRTSGRRGLAGGSHHGCRGVNLFQSHEITSARWESYVLLPDVDCGVLRQNSARAEGDCGQEEESSIVDMNTRVGIVHTNCKAERMCTPSPVPAVVSSLISLSSLQTSNNSELALVKEHKRNKWLGVRMEQQPFVVAGDVLLSVEAEKKVVIVTRLYDVGHGSFQLLNERLTLSSNAHSIEIAECETLGDKQCVETAMSEGKLVLPVAFYTMENGRLPQEHADGGEVPGLLPAAASRWAVHWAANPVLEVYAAIFDFCRGQASFNFNVHSSFGSALVWTVHTMRSVDLEGAGSPSTEDIKSRVSYMRVPQFFGDFFESGETSSDASKYCDVIWGLKIVGVEYLNAQNVLITVLAARPRDYNPYTGEVFGPRIYRYYYLNPERHDCVVDRETADLSSKSIFSCWKSQEDGMWSGDSMLHSGSSGNKESMDSNNVPCAEARVVPALGSAIIMPIVALVRVLETALDSVVTLIAVFVANPQNPSLALRDLASIPLHKASFHSMVDSGGARLLNVEEIISAVTWCTRFSAHLLIHAFDAISTIVANLFENKHVNKNIGGLRTMVVGFAKIKEGGAAAVPQFHQIEKMFEQPIVFSSMHASTAVLRMADGIQGSKRLPMVVTAFMRIQTGMVGSLALVLRLGRILIVRLLQAGAGSPAAVGSSAFLESTSVVRNDFLNTMRFQCYGLAQVVGATQAWGRALQHACLLFPDTLEGVLTVITVLTLEYPTVACACKLGDGDVVGDGALDTLTSICLLRPLPIEETQWLSALVHAQNDRRELCFVTMDRANVLLETAFDKSYRRMYLMTQYAAGVADGVLALITADNSACDAFDVFPYVMSIIPEPVDYFSSCVDTQDCKIRCFEEYTAFEDAKRKVLDAGIDVGFKTEIAVIMESMLFSSDDIEAGRHKPPFLMQELIELPTASCVTVCAGKVSRCIAVAGLVTQTTGELAMELAIAYYCVPIDVTQYAFQWPGMEVTKPSRSQGFPALPGTLVSLHFATTWGAEIGIRDTLVAVVHEHDEGTQRSQTEMLEQVRTSQRSPCFKSK